MELDLIGLILSNAHTCTGCTCSDNIHITLAPKVREHKLILIFCFAINRQEHSRVEERGIHILIWSNFFISLYCIAISGSILWRRTSQGQIIAGLGRRPDVDAALLCHALGIDIADSVSLGSHKAVFVHRCHILV